VTYERVKPTYIKGFVSDEQNSASWLYVALLPLQRVPLYIVINRKRFLAHERAVCPNPPNSSNWILRIVRQLGYKHTCQNVVSTKNFLSLYFRKNITRLSDGVLRIGQVLGVSCKTVYRWITTNGCFMSDIFSLTNNYFVRMWAKILFSNCIVWCTVRHNFIPKYKQKFHLT
jgi:hypothetical protein